MRFAVPKSARSMLSGGTWIASRYVQPNIGSDLALLKAVGKALLEQHAFNTSFIEAHTEGFDDYRMVADLDADNTTDKNITSPQHLSLAIDILSQEKNVSGQFFAWFHFMDPHDEYNVHDGYQTFGTSDRDKYDNEVRTIKIDYPWSFELCGGTHMDATAHARTREIEQLVDHARWLAIFFCSWTMP